MKKLFRLSLFALSIMFFVSCTSVPASQTMSAQTSSREIVSEISSDFEQGEMDVIQYLMSILSSEEVGPSIYRLTDGNPQLTYLIARVDFGELSAKEYAENIVKSAMDKVLSNKPFDKYWTKIVFIFMESGMEPITIDVTWDMVEEQGDTRTVNLSSIDISSLLPVEASSLEGKWVSTEDNSVGSVFIFSGNTMTIHFGLIDWVGELGTTAIGTFSYENGVITASMEYAGTTSTCILTAEWDGENHEVIYITFQSGGIIGSSTGTPYRCEKQ